MAAAGSTAEVFLGMNVKKFIAGAKKGILASKQLVDKFAANQQRMRNMSLKTGIALGAQVLWIRKVTQAAAIQETAEKKLADAVLKNTDATQANVDALIEQAAALQQVTKFGDEATIEAQALLATYGVATELLEEATVATMDFASATGRDLKTAALTVGKAVGAGFTAELSRYGIILDTSTIPKTEVATAVLEKLNSQFGGRAQQEADTYAGRLQRLSNAAGDLNEQIGFALIPTLEKLFKRIQPVIERTARWIERNEDLVAAIVGISAGGTGLLFGLSTMGFLLAGLPMLMTALISPTNIIIAGVLALAGALVILNLRGRAIPGTLEEINTELAGQEAQLASLQKQIAVIDFKTPKDDAGRYVDALQQLKFEELAKETKILEDRIAKLTAVKQILFEQEERDRQAKLSAALAVPIAPEDELPVIPTPMIDDAAGEFGHTLETLTAMHDEWANTTIGKNEEVAESVRLLYNQNAVNAAQTFFNSLEGMAERFQGNIGKAIVGGIINALKSVIDAYVATEVAKATAGAPLSFGATLAAIGPIVAAGAVGKAALNAILGSMDSFQFGGVVQETGPAFVHKGERIINPEHPESMRNAGMMGDIHQSVAFYGPLNHKIDIADASRELAKRTRFALNMGI